MATRLPPSRNRLLGRLIVGRLIGGLRLRLRGGPDRGSWWSIASSGRGCLSRRFEAQRIDDASIPRGQDQELLAVGPDSGLAERHLRSLDLFAA